MNLADSQFTVEIELSEEEVGRAMTAIDAAVRRARREWAREHRDGATCADCLIHYPVHIIRLHPAYALPGDAEAVCRNCWAERGYRRRLANLHNVAADVLRYHG